MHVRKITRDDKEQVRKLAKEESSMLKKFASQPVYEVAWSEKLFDRLFAFNCKKDHFFYGVEEKGKIVALLSGYIKPEPKGDVGYIDNMFVSKKFHGRGYASLLRDEFFNWLKEHKIKYCQLHVLEHNPAKEIYKKWGFMSDKVQMTRRL